MYIAALKKKKELSNKKERKEKFKKDYKINSHSSTVSKENALVVIVHGKKFQKKNKKNLTAWFRSFYMSDGKHLRENVYIFSSYSLSYNSYGSVLRVN